MIDRQSRGRARETGKPWSPSQESLFMSREMTSLKVVTQSAASIWKIDPGGRGQKLSHWMGVWQGRSPGAVDLGGGFRGRRGKV